MNLDTSRIDASVAALRSILSVSPDHARLVHTCTFTPRGSSRSTSLVDAAGATSTAPKGPALSAAQEALEAATNIRPVAFELTVHSAGSWQLCASDTLADVIERHPIRFDETPVKVSELTEVARTELADAWNAGSSDYFAEPPATNEELEDLALRLGVPVPPPLVALLQLTNGAEIDDPEDWDATVTAGWSLLSAEDIAAAHDRLVEDASYGHNSGAVNTPADQRLTQLRALHPGWIPFATDDSGNYLGLDTVPGPDGSPGQVLEFGTDYPDGAVVRAESLPDFLAGRRLPDPPHAATSRRLSIADVDSVDLTGHEGLLELFVARVDRFSLAHPHLRALSVDTVGAFSIAGLPALEKLTLRSIPEDSLIDELATHSRLNLIDVSALPLRDRVRVYNAVADSPATTVEFAG